MLKLTMPKNGTKNLYYVSSEGGGDSHVIVRHGGLFFCDCRDFMIRRLPVLGTSKFKPCKHGEFVAFVTRTIPEGASNVFAFRQTTVSQNDQRFVETTIVHEAPTKVRHIAAGRVRCAR